MTKEVCTALVDVLLPKYVQFPSGESLKEVVNGFKVKCGFPQCAETVDGTHIPAISPDMWIIITDYACTCMSLSLRFASRLQLWSVDYSDLLRL